MSGLVVHIVQFKYTEEAHKQPERMLEVARAFQALQQNCKIQGQTYIISIVAGSNDTCERKNDRGYDVRLVQRLTGVSELS